MKREVGAALAWARAVSCTTVQDVTHTLMRFPLSSLHRASQTRLGATAAGQATYHLEIGARDIALHLKFASSIVRTKELQFTNLPRRHWN